MEDEAAFTSVTCYRQISGRLKQTTLPFADTIKCDTQAAARPERRGLWTNYIQLKLWNTISSFVDIHSMCLCSVQQRVLLISHLFALHSSHQGDEELEAFPACTGKEAGCPLSRLQNRSAITLLKLTVERQFHI